MRKFWMGYFIASIAFWGFIFSSMCIPLFKLSRIFPKLLVGARFICQRGTGVLMWAQPWLRTQLDFSKFAEIRSKHPKILFVGNHRSHLDVFILLTQIPGIRIFANSYIFKVPGLGVMMKVTGQIPVEQNRMDSFVQGMKTVRDLIEQGENAFVFPELTRCPPGHKGTLNFSSAPFKAAMDAGAVIVPVVIQNTDKVWPRGKMEISWGITTNFEMLDPISTSQFSSADELRNFVRSRIDTELGERPVYPIRPREITV